MWPISLECPQEVQGLDVTRFIELHRGKQGSQVGLGVVALPGEGHVSDRVPANDAVKWMVGATQCTQRYMVARAGRGRH